MFPDSSHAIKVFFSYAPEDEPLRDGLAKQLSLLKRQGLIEEWHDRRITPGTVRETAIDEHLDRANLILLLVSADFISSDHRYGVELSRALERHRTGEARVIPILLRAVDLTDAPFSKLQTLPAGGRPVTSWPNQDEAFADIARGIREVVMAMRAHGRRDGGSSGADRPAWLTSFAAERAGWPLGRDELLKEEESKEREYLIWLSSYLKRRNQEWDKQSDPDIVIIPTPAHPRKSVNPPGEPAQTQKIDLYRHDPNDYLKNQTLKHVELATRALFGRRTKIKDLAKELRRHNKIVVLGDPGSGKSVCLRQLAYDICQRELKRRGRPRTLPIYVEMTTYDQWEEGTAGEPISPLKFLQSSLTDPSIADDPEHPLLYISERLTQILRAGRATLIFDALDEMPQESYHERFKTLKRFTGTWEEGRTNRFIFSCRLLDYDPAFAVSEIIIDPFDKRKIRQYLSENAAPIWHTLYQLIEDNEVLEELLSNPFFLRAWTYLNLWHHEVSNLRPEGQQPQVPTSRGELIAAFAEALLVREVESKQKELLGRVDGGLPTLHLFLSEIGFALQEGRPAPTENFGDIWARYPQWKELLWIAQRAHILGERGVIPDAIAVKDPNAIKLPRRIEFKHHRLQEYFAAAELAKRLAAGEAVDRYLEDIWWQETVVFAIGIVKDPRPIIERMLAPQADTDGWIRDVLAQAQDPHTTGGG